jgi:hypothetical protein
MLTEGGNSPCLCLVEKERGAPDTAGCFCMFPSSKEPWRSIEDKVTRNLFCMEPVPLPHIPTVTCWAKVTSSSSPREEVSVQSVADLGVRGVLGSWSDQSEVRCGNQTLYSWERMIDPWDNPSDFEELIWGGKGSHNESDPWVVLWPPVLRCNLSLLHRLLPWCHEVLASAE